ncbi:hypothetical protein M2283_010049 [Streptomyces pseudovenezuelae]|uniref:Uncharacterized protein n=1 Tax=Streptomyces pseudovenezuelae TaxID=67350 RepID=A0ABT6M2C3_9ACTN|nr:hypothetical protein [Streptomyces pseudovenezuelae]
MSDRRSRSHASHPPSLESGRSVATEATQPARSCSYRPPDPTPHRSTHDRQPTVPGSAPTSPPPPSPQPTETDHPPVAGHEPPPTHRRLTALGLSRSPLADPSPSRLGPPRLHLAGCPRSRLGRGSGHSRTESRRQLSTDHPHSRHPLGLRDGVQAAPPRATTRPAANPPPTPASTPTPAPPQHSPPTTPRYRGERPATPPSEPDDPPHEPSSASPPWPAATTHRQTTATTSHSHRLPHPGARTPADGRRRRTRPPKRPREHSNAAPTPQDRKHRLRTPRRPDEGPQTRRAPFCPWRSPGTALTTAPPHSRHSHRPGKHQLTATTRPYRCCRCPAGGAPLHSAFLAGQTDRMAYGCLFL